MARINEGENVTHSARVWDVDGVLLLNADFSGSDVDVEVYDSDGVLIYSSADQSIAGFLSDTLTTGGRWGNKDGTGYNFTFAITQATIATGVGGTSMLGGEKYRTVYRLKPTSKSPQVLTFWDEVIRVAS